MTRKRKVEHAADDVSQKSGKLSNYGYQTNEQPSSSVSDDGRKRTFPRKERHGTFQRENPGYNSKDRSSHYDGGDRNQDNGYYNSAETTVEGSNGQESTDAYPSELVAYLKNIEQMKLTEGHIENVVMDKCAQECSGEEEKLLMFRDSCIVVEGVFGSSQYGAALFLSGLARLKHKRLLELIYSGQSARTIETLFYAMEPIDSIQNVQLIEKFAELLCDNWNDAVSSQHSSFLIRCIARVSCGLPRKGNEKELAAFRPKTKGDENIRLSLSRVFERIALLALDSLSSPSLENVHRSLVIQDVLEADSVAKLGKSAALVEKVLEKTDEQGVSLRRVWQGKNSSRVWEKLVVTCQEETLQSLWERVITGHVGELASHPCANFTLQKFISSVKSLELATDVCHEVTPLLSTFLSNSRWGVAEALLRCAAKHEELQEPLLKELRRYFRAEKASNKLNFLYNVITLNNYNGTSLNIERCDLHGCLLMEVLLSFKKVKTLRACFEALSSDDVVRLAKNNRASHVLQAAFKSTTLGDDVKEKLIAAFESDWGSLISDVYGSHVFETIWDCSLFTVNRRQTLMKKLVPIHSDSKFWKFAMLRCDIYLFRKDRKAWVEKMKKSIKGAKQ
ncbi:unnamed protein product [Cylicocyclus nassatus]|uniref:Nucleolar protein 9 n=1 Tax=Cylicocyclus nassatus TaxID=53992 RepID=A0AA36H2K5_CYLNA|nr:unnamed protein product [Cylicocyclus nassatus]